MTTSSLPRPFRFAAMGLTLLAVAALALMGGTWATPVMAQTVPPPTPSPTPVTVSGPDLLESMDLGIGSVTLDSSAGGAAPGHRRTTIVEATTEIVGAAALQPTPRGWALLTQGIRVTAENGSGQDIPFFARGITVCFNLPAGASAYSQLRIGYFDGSPAINRWVFLRTQVSNGVACTSGFHLPATFALFGR